MKKQTNISPYEMYYDASELSKNLNYVKVIYTDLDEKIDEIETQVKFVGERLISLFFTCKKPFDVAYPQEIGLKFVTDNALYAASAILNEVKRTDDTIFLTVLPPKKMIKRQDRRCQRVDLERTCVVVITDEKGFSKTYLSKSINLSACGVLLYNLQTMMSDKVVDLNMSILDCYHIIIFLEPDLILKQFAIYVRDEFVGRSRRYAFQFMSMTPETTETINKYVEKELANQKKLAQK